MTDPEPNDANTVLVMALLFFIIAVLLIAPWL